MEINVKKFISIFSFFLIFNHDFIIYIYFIHIAASNTASDESQTRSHIEYLIQIYYILMLILSSKLVKNLAFVTDFNTTK